MPEPLNLIGALLLSLMGHEVGHQAEADRLNVPMDWEGTASYANTQDKDELARIANAGLLMGQHIGEISPELRLANALNKAGYAIFPDSVSSAVGDMGTIGATKGGKAQGIAQGALALSALADLHKYLNPDRKWDLGFWQSQSGTPGLRLRLLLD